MSARPRVGFVLEQTLGHVTHADNLVRLLTPDTRIRADFAPIDFEVDRHWARVPGYRNWTVRAGLRARQAVRALERRGKLDALFVHTQVPATLIPDVLRRLPSVVSLDATPKQYDELGGHYGHSTNGERVERAKRRLHQSCFARADRLVTWATWTKDSLVEDYGVSPDKIVVIPPGVDRERWTASEVQPDGAGEALRVLFVGADFSRKGGYTLLAAVRQLRRAGVPVELDVVTRDAIPPEGGVNVHLGLAPNSPPLIALYRRADVFCLPTLGDCLPMVLSEAGAAGLPLVSTDVGAIREIVRPDQTGLLVRPGDEAALAAALDRLLADSTLRQWLGENARRLVDEEFDAAKNASRLVDLLSDVARAC